VGRVTRGTIKVGDRVVVMKQDGSEQSFRVSKLFGFIGLKRIEIKEAKAGEIVAVSGMDKINIGETICPEGHLEALHLLHIDEQTLKMTIIVNNSPITGKEREYITSNKIE